KEPKKQARRRDCRGFGKRESMLACVAGMACLTGALYVGDINRGHSAVDEARKLNTPVIAMVDTNCDPDLVDFPIPANDDALKSIELVTSVISRAVSEGKRAREVQEAGEQARKEKQQETAAE